MKQIERARSFTRLNRPKRRTKRRASGGTEDTVCRPRIKRTPPKRRERNGRTFKNSPFFVPHDNLQKRQIHKRKNALSIYKRNKKSHKPQFKTALAKTAENRSREGEFLFKIFNYSAAASFFSSAAVFFSSAAVFRQSAQSAKSA